MSPVRVRFAPSPTGFFHIGSARTALFNWLYARHTGGVFVLRIEDTDQARNKDEYLRVIYDSLRWLGMDWDEGPGVGGDYGPYRQSERAELYRAYLEKLLATDRAYEKDGAIWFRLLGPRSEVFDEHRQKTVTKVATAPTVIDDRIRGRVERLEDEDFVIFRSDGQPVFHFVNVVDDIAMGITHVIRGEDHLSNASKHVELFKAFGAPVPQYAHIPLILKQNGPGKMSKRDQGALIEEYQRRGYRPEALVNFLSLLGWNPGHDREKMPQAEIIAQFDLPQVNQSNARFDDKKLAHMNMQYLQEMPLEKFAAALRAYLQGLVAIAPAAPASAPPAAPASPSATIAASTSTTSLASTSPASTPTPTAAAVSAVSPTTLAQAATALAAAAAAPDYFLAVVRLCQPKLKSLEEFPAYTGYFFTEAFASDPAVRAKVLNKGTPRARLAELLAALPALDFSSDAALETGIKEMAQSHGLAFTDYQPIARLAVSGTNAGPSLTSLFVVLGSDRVTSRLQAFQASLGTM